MGINCGPPPERYWPIAYLERKTDACELCSRIEPLYRVLEEVLVCKTCAHDVGYIPQPMRPDGEPIFIVRHHPPTTITM